jgi:hypothetical protein
VENDYAIFDNAVEDSTGWLNDLAILHPAKFFWNRTALGMSLKLLDMSENPPHQFASRFGLSSAM